MDKLDLEKYGISYLKEKNPATWTDADMDKLIDAFAKEDIAPYLTMPPTQRNIEILLSQSHCRRCGQCCTSNPDDPGVMVSEGELQKMAAHSKYTYKYLKRHSTKYEHSERNDVRYLPIPCIFYEQGKCTIYKWRPFICKVYPTSNAPRNGKVCVTISLRCDYGKEIYKSVLKHQRKKAINKLFDT
jgi:Fe-S-cluster containining protein